MLGTEFDWLSIGSEVLNLVPKLVVWRVYEMWRGRTERTNLTSHISSAVINLSLLIPGALCPWQRCVVVPCMESSPHLGDLQ